MTRFCYTDVHQRVVYIRKKEGRSMIGRGRRKEGGKGKGGKEERKETIENTNRDELDILCMVYTKKC